MRRWSQDLRARVPVLRYEQGYSVKRIRTLLGISKTAVYDILNEFKRTRGYDFEPIVGRRTGRRRKLTRGDLKFVAALMEHRRCYYLDEIMAELALRHGVSVSVATIGRVLHRLLVTSKAVSARAAERCEL